jgi:hypothetical protein
MRAKHPSRKMGGASSRPVSSRHQAGQFRRPGAEPVPAWGDQSLEERIPSFLETLYFESEACLTASHRRPG